MACLKKNGEIFMKKRSAAAAIAAMAGVTSSVLASSAVTGGDLVVYRVGDGSQTLVNTGNSVFLDEYPSAGGSLVQSIALPTTTSGTSNALIASGTASSEGQLSISPNGQYIALTGYDSPLGGTSSLSGTKSTTIPRTVGILNVSTGSVDTSTALTDAYNKNNPRGAVTTDGTEIWTAGADSSSGPRYTTIGSTTSVALSTTLTNARAVDIFNGQLYASSGSTGFVGINQIGTGLPTTTGQTNSLIASDPSDPSPYAFYFTTLPGAGFSGINTLYVADSSGAASPAPEIAKYSASSAGGPWTLTGEVDVPSPSAATSIIGLAGETSSDGVTLFTSAPSNIFSYTDTSGYDVAPSATPFTTIATAGTNEAFRGIAYVPTAPVPEPASIGVLSIACLAALRRRRGLTSVQI
jgi:hypothetical protein